MWPIDPFWYAKYLSFEEKLPIWTTHHTFLESRPPDVTKNPYYVLTPDGCEKKVSAHGLKGLIFVILCKSFLISS